MTWLAMFVMCMGLDLVYVFWLREVHDKRKWRAASWSALCVLIGSLTTVFCVWDLWLILPQCLGHACGTVIAMSLGGGNGNDLSSGRDGSLTPTPR